MIIVRSDTIPFRGFIAITLWPFIFVRRQAWAKFTNDVIRHERIHGRQQVELLAVGAVIAAVLALCGAGWWSLLALPLFLWCYVLEWLLLSIHFGSTRNAYRAISFEREAYDNELNADYLKERKPFAWLRYLF
jgi:fatty acid desaturase